MGKKDVEEKTYFDDDLHFADACNGILFQGVRKILPEELEESLAYYKQWKKNKKRYSKEYRKWLGKLLRLRNSKEFLSGMQKEDKFIPVILIVINWSLEKWDGAKTLHEMLELPSELERYVNNYKLNIFDYHNHNDFSVFETEVRVVFEALKAAGEKENMKDLFKRIREIEIDTARLLETLLSIKFNKKYIVKDEAGREYLEVCKAWEDNLKEGIEQGIAIGIEQGTEQTLFRIVCKKVKKNYTLDMIADDLEEDIEVIRPIYERAKKVKTEYMWRNIDN